MQKLNIDLRIAKKLGVKEAIVLSFLQRLTQDLIDRRGGTHEGRHWIKMPIHKLTKTLGIYTNSTVIIAIERLESLNMITIKKSMPNGTRAPIHWYSVNQEGVGRVLRESNEDLAA